MISKNAPGKSSDFQRFFLIFSNEDGGYEAGQKPSGHVRVEVREGRGKLHAAVQNLRPGNGRFIYKLYLLSTGGNGVKAACAGQLKPEPNKAELEWSFDPGNVGGTGAAIGEFDVAAVLAEHSDRSGDAVICPLAAYKGKKTEWRSGMRTALLKSKMQAAAKSVTEAAASLQYGKHALPDNDNVSEKKNQPGGIPGGRNESDASGSGLYAVDEQPANESQPPQEDEPAPDHISHGKVPQKQEKQEYYRQDKFVQEIIAQGYMPQEQAMYEQVICEPEPQEDEPREKETQENGLCEQITIEFTPYEYPQQEDAIREEMPREYELEGVESKADELQEDEPRGFMPQEYPQQRPEEPENMHGEPGTEEQAHRRQESMEQEQAPIRHEAEQNKQYQTVDGQIDTDCLYLNGNMCSAFVNNSAVTVNPCAACHMNNGRPRYSEPLSGDVSQLREELDRYFERCDPFHSNRSDYLWWRVNNPVNLNNLLYQCNIRSPLLFNPAVMMAHYKYRHLIVGIFLHKARNKKYVVCGVPGMSMVDKKPFGDMSRWVQAEGNRPRYGAFGYWLVYIDPDGGKILNINQE